MQESRLVTPNLIAVYARESKIPALDGIRGVAILLVLIKHCGDHVDFTPGMAPFKMLLTPMWCGVDLFFVLSGFLITGILIRTRNARNRASSFYVRRALRIFPTYYLTLTAVFAFFLLAPTVGRRCTFLRSASDFTWFAVYLQNWMVLWNPKVPLFGVIGHLWSLGVEEQFYLVWPLLVWSVPLKRLPQVCFGLALCAFVLRTILVAHFGPHYWIHALTPTRGEALLTGSGLAALTALRPLRASELTSLAVLGATLFLSILILDPLEFINTDIGPYMYTIGVTGLGLVFGALVASCQRRLPLLTTVLNQGWLRNFGKYSYGLYIYHVPVLFLMRALCTHVLGTQVPLRLPQAFVYACAVVAVSYATAWVSFHLFEVHFLRWKERFSTIEWNECRQPAPVVVGLV